MMRGTILPILLTLSMAACGTETSAAPNKEPRLIASFSPEPPPDGGQQSFARVPLPAEPAVEPEPGGERCDPNYRHPPCVPIDSDVDCAGGRGDGPSYVRGPVRVIGRDIYRLDHDRDGIGCER